MKNLLRLVWLAPLAIVATACGDDSSDGEGGSSADTTSSVTSTTSTTTTTTTTTGNTTTTTTSGGEGGGGGGTGEGGGGAPPVNGDPLDVTPETWTWVDFPTSRCIDDSPTGIGVNVSASNDEDIVIFLQGGNACFNLATCFVTANTDGYGADKFENDSIVDADLFQRDAANPIGDWSWAYVPYCTGDVHAGDNAGVEVGGQERTFRGYKNIGDYLARIVPTFPNAKRVLLTGVSAGGFGAAYNYDQVKRAFGDDVDVYLIDDSGPPMSAEFVEPCLQGRFKELWGLDNTLPEACDDCRTGETFTEEYLDYVFSEYPDQRFAIVSATGDATIRSFWSFGNNDCANIEGAPGAYAEEKYTDGLIDIRDRMAAGANFALFMPESTRHVWVNDASGLSTTVGESPTLIDWIDQTINDDAAWQSWPAAE